MAFSAEWLALREPADRAARSSTLVEHLAGHLPRSRPLEVLDLACGTGANLRALADLLPGPQQRWLLVDHDRTLLEAARGLMEPWLNTRDPRERASRAIEMRALDLRDLSRTEIFSARTLVTASALLDLVSEDWLTGLVDHCRTHRAAVLFALTYDGRMTCAPEEPGDDLVRELVNRHQRRDKGLGPALGPTAPEVATRLLQSAGYSVRRESSDWGLGPESGPLQEALVAGWSDAATEEAPDESDAVRRWRSTRLAHIAGGQSRIIVGHQDLAGWLEL